MAVETIAETCASEAQAKCARLLVDVEGAAGGPMPLLQFGSDAKGKEKSYVCHDGDYFYGLFYDDASVVLSP